MDKVYGRYASFLDKLELKKADKYIKRVFPNAEYYVDYELGALVFEPLENEEVDLEDRTVINEKGFSVVECKVGENDHVHCFVSAPPKISVTQIVKYLKGISGNQLFREYPQLRKSLWKGQLWNGSYFCETIGSTSEENILRYIERQKDCQL